MRYIYERQKAGVLNISNMRIEHLKQLAKEATGRDQDALGHEILYRKD